MSPRARSGCSVKVELAAMDRSEAPKRDGEQEMAEAQWSNSADHHPEHVADQ